MLRATSSSSETRSGVPCSLALRQAGEFAEVAFPDLLSRVGVSGLEPTDPFGDGFSWQHGLPAVEMEANPDFG